VKSIIGKETVQRELPDILYDESRYTLGIPERVYYPENTGDVAEVIKKAMTDNRTVTVIGAQTGITGGAVPTDSCYAISFSSMRKIVRVETGSDAVPILYCQPGVTLKDIQEFLANPSTTDFEVSGMELLSGRHWFYPPDPTEITAHLGGTVATNASGARSYTHGSTRDHVVSLSLVMANGETMTVTRGQSVFHNGTGTFVTDQGTAFTIPALQYQSPGIKNSAGYYYRPEMDGIDLFIGSEGTLAVFTEIGIRLYPHQTILGGLTFFPSRTQAFQFADFLQAQDAVAAIEYFDTTALDIIAANNSDAPLAIPSFPENSSAAVYWEFIERDTATFEECMDTWEEALAGCGSSFDMTWSGFDASEMERLKTFRRAVPELVNTTIARYKKKYPSIQKVSTDCALPPEAFAGYFDRVYRLIHENNLQQVIFGHLGDYHIHFNIIPRTQQEFDTAIVAYQKIMEITVSCGGTISAEHGIGKYKAQFLKKAYIPEALQEMRKIKHIFDPKGILNPGNIFGLS